MSHMSSDFYPDEDGWYWATCTCGFRFGPLPDAETCVDALMDHAYEMGFDA